MFQNGQSTAVMGLSDTQRGSESVIDPDLAVVIKDPLRVQILAVAIKRPVSPSEFAKQVDCRLSVVAYHFRVLVKHGFLELVELIPVRGSTKHMYRATKNGYISDTSWAQIAEVLRPGIAGAALQDFVGQLKRALDTGSFYARDDSYLLWVSLALDEVSWPKFVELMGRAYSEAKELEVETVERRANGEAEGSVPATFAIAGFESPGDSDGDGVKAAIDVDDLAADRAGKV